MLFLSFGRVFRAQNYVSHSVLQTTQAIAQDYYIYEKAIDGTTVGSTVGSISELLSAITDLKPIKTIKDFIAVQIGWSNIRHAMEGNVFKRYMKSVVGEELEESLINLGLEEGLDSLEVEKIEMNDDSGDIYVHVKYKVKLLFPFLGYEDMQLEQTARAHIWKVD